MKKLFAVFMSVLMLCTMIPFTAVAADADYYIELAAHAEEVSTGDEVVVDVSLYGHESVGLVFAEIELGFDPDVFELVTTYDEYEETWMPPIEVGRKYNTQSNRYVLFPYIDEETGYMERCLVQFFRGTATANQAVKTNLFYTVTFRVKDDAKSGNYTIEVINHNDEKLLIYGNETAAWSMEPITIRVNGNDPAPEPPACEHEYEYACDTNCRLCGEIRVASDHVYDDALDAHCNVCGDTRSISGVTGDCTWTLDGTHLTISGNGAMGDYSPSNKAPWGTAITSVTIGDSVTSIRSYAFYECTSLQSVTIGDSVTSIGWYAFSNCTSLQSVTIPDSVTSIGGWAFAYCLSLQSVTIPDRVTSIGRSAFECCLSLMSVTIPDSVTEIGIYAFYYCASLQSVTIPDRVTSIGVYAFYQCNSLTSVTIPNSVTSIGESAFYYCFELTDVYYEGNETDRDAITIYSYNDPLLYATWHYVCDHEYEYACDTNCRLCGETTNEEAAHSLIHVPAVEGNCITLGHGEYWYCEYCGACWGDNLLPPSPPRYGDHKYDAVATTPTCTVSGYTTYTCSVCGDTYTETIPALGHTYDNACDADCNECGDTRSISGVTGDCTWTLDGTHLTISGNGAMGKYYSNNSHTTAPWGWDITSVTIGDGVTTIGNCAFDGCYALSTVTIPNSVTTIGLGAFSNCTSLTSVTIPDSVTSMGSGAFAHCTSLTSITIPDSVTDIVGSAFYNCSSLTSVTIPDSVTKIGGSAFYGCTALTDVYYGGSEKDRANITIVGSYNAPLLNATWHYAACDHAYVGTVITPADCYDDGETTYTCSTCGDTYTETIPALGHDLYYYSEDICWQGHYSATRCTRCDHIEDWSYIPCMEHHGLIELGSKDPTCTEDGYEYAYTCTACGETGCEPIPALGHTYDNACDTDCNVCGEIREVSGHVYDNVCDTDCNECGETRATSGHVYDNVCDTDCNECGETRATSGHVYDNACDTICNVCGAIRKIAGHTYDNDCDTACNECGATRVAPHAYSNVCDRDCNLCGATRIAPHVYDNACDNACNLCGAKRKPIDHVYDSDCDSDCNECGAIREDIRHTYTDSCDRDCNVCGDFREPPHDYADKYDDTCDTCDEWREVEIIYGDVDEDGRITLLDATVLSQYLSGWDASLDEVAADTDGDGQISLLDAALLAQYLSGWDVNLG